MDLDPKQLKDLFWNEPDKLGNWFTENHHKLGDWFKENQDEMKPPIGNKIITPDSQLIIMGVSGPNSRKDYHYHQRGPEIFYQVQGDITLKIMEDKGPEDILIEGGQMYFMEMETIHSPQRPENTFGVVLESHPLHGERDYFKWYCENTKCNNLLHQVDIDLKDIVADLPPLLKKFNDSLELRTCKVCDYVMEPPK